MTLPIIIAIIGVVTTFLGTAIGTGGMYAWFKLGPERKKITVEVAHEAVVIHSSVLKDIKEDYDRVSNELGLLKMEIISLEKENEDCRKRVQALESSVIFLQRDLDRHGRMAEMSRRKAHLAANTLGLYELHVEQQLEEMRGHGIVITSEMRTQKLRAAYQAEMNKLDELESTVTEQAIKEEPPCVDELDEPAV